MQLSAASERPIARVWLRLARRRAVRAQAWIPRVAAAVADQGLFTGTTFAVNLLLARWLETVHYGAFAAAYSAFVLIAALYNAIAVEPMLVFGAERHRARFRAYLGGLLVGHAVVVLATSAMVMAVGLALRSVARGDGGAAVGELGTAMVGVAVALPSVLATWLLRRACYVRRRHALAATASGLYLVVTLGGLYLIDTYGELTVVSGFLAMGAAGVVAASSLAAALRPSAPGERVRPRILAEEHWAHGKWLLSTSVFAWIGANVYYLVLPGAVGLGGTAALRAVSNVLTPWYQGMIAVSVLLIPHLTGVAEERGALALRKLSSTLVIGYAAAWAILWCALAIAREPLMHALYRGRYDASSDLLLLMAITPLPLGAGYVLSAAARARGRPDVLFRSYLVSTLVTLTLGVGLLWVGFGVPGAIVGGIGASSAGTATLAWFLFRSE